MTRNNHATRFGWQRFATRACLHLAIAILATATLFAAAETDSWRRTNRGWEHVESWTHLVTPPIGKLRPLTRKTLLQRSWPALFALTEVLLLLAIVDLSRSKKSE